MLKIVRQGFLDLVYQKLLQYDLGNIKHLWRFDKTRGAIFDHDFATLGTD